MSFTPSFAFISELPAKPAVYTLHGGQGRGKYTAYVGVTSNLKSRIRQHFIRRDSSIVTATSAAMLNPDYVTEIRWWLDSRFEDKHKREAAELIAFDLFEPTLRSRGGISTEAEKKSTELAFEEEMTELFQGEPTGQIETPSLEEALKRIHSLEQEVADLRAKVDATSNNE